MGQVLGFSHCQEYGSVASTPDSTPPCTDGGNDESELYELQTAREWSDDGDEDQDDDDDEGLASSPSSWFTPRQNSLELTFSYIAIAEAEAVGTSRQLRDRRRGGRASRAAAPLIRADTLETLLDLPDVEWNPHAFLSRDEEEEAAGRREQERSEERTAARHDDGRPGTPPPPVQPPPLPLRPELEPRRANQDIQREESETDSSLPPSPPQTLRPSATAAPQQHGAPSQSLQVFSQTDGVRSSSCPAAVVAVVAVAAMPPTEPESPLAMETSSVTLLASARPRGGVNGDTASAACCVATGQSTQKEQPVSGHWFSGLDLPEDLSACVRIAVMDLIYWKDTERSGMVLTGLVVGLLSLFQLSIITVLSTLALAVVCVTISVRIYYQILHALNWGDGEHPFKAYLDLDTSLSGEQAEHYTRKAIVTFLSSLNTLRNLIFVGNVYDSLKFLALMYLLTFLGKLCNGLTLLIIGMIALFSLPLYYRQRKEQVDSVLAKIHAQVDNVLDILQRLAHGGSRPPDPTAGGDDEPKSQ